MTIFHKMTVCLFVSLTILAFSILFHPPLATADTAQYAYDELGRLTQVINGSSITNYNYDEVGNIISVGSGSLTDTPSVTNVTPTALLVGVKTPVVFTGQNLLSAGTVTALGSNITVNSLTIEANKITTMLTALSAGTDTIKITFRDTNQTVYQSNLDAVAATVTMSPSLIVAQPNSTATATVSLNPPLAYPVTIGLRTGQPTIATVPSTATVPAGGTSDVQITTLAEGATNITSLSNVTYSRVVSEKPIGGNGVTSPPVSVMILPAVTSAPGIIASRPVSVMIMPSVQQPTVAAQMSKPVSVVILPSAQTIAPSVTVSHPVSVIIPQ